MNAPKTYAFSLTHSHTHHSHTV